MLYIAGDARRLARAIGLEPRFTPVQSPQSNGMAEAFVRTVKRDCVRRSPVPDAAAVIGQLPNWFDHHNTVPPSSGPRTQITPRVHRSTKRDLTPSGRSGATTHARS